MKKKGYGTEILKLVLKEARDKKIYRVLIGSHKTNIGSCKVIENCNGILENTVIDPDNFEEINRYWINNKEDIK